MKKIFRFITAFLAVIFMLGGVMVAEAAQKIVAVMPIQSIINNDYCNYAAEAMTEELVNVFVNSGSYTVIEREQLGSVIREMGFQQTGMVDPNSAIEIGKLSGAQYILVGKITMADVYMDEIPLLGYRTRAKVGLNYRLLDGKTGRVLYSSAAEDTHSDAFSRDVSAQVFLHKACAGVAEKILKEMQKKNPIVGTVLDVSGETAYIDLGRESGIHEGEKLLVYKEGAPILNTSGEIIATRTIDVGELKVTEVSDNYSICEVTKVVDDKAPFTRGALVKREFKD